MHNTDCTISQPISIQHLTREIQENIFFHLPLSAIIAVQLTCKQFYEVCKDRDFFKKQITLVQEGKLEAEITYQFSKAFFKSNHDNCHEEFLRLAAHQGSLSALCQIPIHYFTGENFKKALPILNAAKENPFAQYRLSFFIQDTQQAEHLKKLSALNGNALALIEMAKRHGINIKENKDFIGTQLKIGVQLADNLVVKLLPSEKNVETAKKILIDKGYPFFAKFSCLCLSFLCKTISRCKKIYESKEEKAMIKTFLREISCGSKVTLALIHVKGSYLRRDDQKVIMLFREMIQEKRKKFSGLIASLRFTYELKKVLVNDDPLFIEVEKILAEELATVNDSYLLGHWLSHMYGEGKLPASYDKISLAGMDWAKKILKEFLSYLADSEEICKSFLYHLKYKANAISKKVLEDTLMPIQSCPEKSLIYQALHVFSMQN